VGVPVQRSRLRVAAAARRDGRRAPEDPDPRRRRPGHRERKDADLKQDEKTGILWLTGTDAKIDHWPAARSTCSAASSSLAVDHVAAQTRTPPHYLIGKMANMAAEALTVAETGLVAKVVQRQTNFTVGPQREMYQRIALAQGNEPAKLARTGKIVWSDPQYRSLSQKIDAFQKFRSAGMPLEWTCSSGTASSPTTSSAS
jgi:hypothetical protein